MFSLKVVRPVLLVAVVSLAAGPGAAQAGGPDDPYGLRSTVQRVMDMMGPGGTSAINGLIWGAVSSAEQTVTNLGLQNGRLSRSRLMGAVPQIIQSSEDAVSAMFRHDQSTTPSVDEEGNGTYVDEDGQPESVPDSIRTRGASEPPPSSVGLSGVLQDRLEESERPTGER
jgi:hypothetical protein